ncbi:MAG: hypothetical protein J6R62_04345 [Rikenellaceae bacterium]|nr:hypothetical protein [Rikenellaceae bacterium]
MNKSVKLTKEEMAERIIAEGRRDVKNSHGGFEIYNAFGQRWCIIRGFSGKVQKITQIDKDGREIHL